MIGAGDSLALMAVLMALAALGFRIEHTRLGALLTGTVVVILAAIAAANLQIIPHQAPAYDFVFRYVVPVIVPLFLFQADLRRMVTEASRLTLAFLLAALGTVTGVVVALRVVSLQDLALQVPLQGAELGAALGGLFASTYIGGSVNFAALGEITGLSGDASFFSAATAVDNVYSALYLGLLALLPGWRWLARRFPAAAVQAAPAGGSPAAISAHSLCYALTGALVIVALSDALVALLGTDSLRYVFITVFSVGLATLAPGVCARLAGAQELGVLLSYLFFAAIAAGADIAAMIELAPVLMLMATVLLSLHALVLGVLGRALGLTLPELITASNAAVLGATTAPALAATRGWTHLVSPAVLVGVLGYALGTLVGTWIFESGAWLF